MNGKNIFDVFPVEKKVLYWFLHARCKNPMQCGPMQCDPLLTKRYLLVKFLCVRTVLYRTFISKLEKESYFFSIVLQEFVDVESFIFLVSERTVILTYGDDNRYQVRFRTEPYISVRYIFWYFSFLIRYGNILW